ncbi:hypothetical protein BX616_010194 [Lobosporangium transversale]|uniref:Tim-barrel domain-domain-containing protein n=1 Tax=Lobosporangium transversale TaxID=64571 RepID=A0A1Y2H550_9FUNG|nr:tim-barrel domain-domain-containing protein [Lobosporangium transversale]KAF9912980.1 hypothetical protein BX616_010194 [Lobosporangium transversale]ORZ29111.1 tim-barrel domain-domain-containing protein [Lobosporangium transversale]|eukprot:XP_021886784.1 tim-barrel domain-domain-containing protein [Lobosporangium transversale]
MDMVAKLPSTEPLALQQQQRQHQHQHGLRNALIYRLLHSRIFIATLFIWCWTYLASLSGPEVFTQVHALKDSASILLSGQESSWKSIQRSASQQYSPLSSSTGSYATLRLDESEQDHPHFNNKKRAVTATPSISEQPLYDLVKRRLPPAYHETFIFTLVPGLTPASATNIHDTFRVSNRDNGTIMIEGATLSGLGAGLNYYLRNACEVEMSWSGDRFMDVPNTPPAIQDPEGKGVIRASFVPWRYYMNVVTFGYSFAFWDWKRWERELDWMMLNGVNMALAMVGQEYVFREMYESLGATRQELNGFFSGPAFMAWQRMGNIQGSWGVTNDTRFKHDWIDSQWQLQGHIMRRMNEFNMTAILPSFNGFVPREFPAKFPHIKFDRASDWDFLGEVNSRNTFISSTEPFFANLTSRFIQTQSTLYQKHGFAPTTDKNYYLLDLFNELRPVCTKQECLRSVTNGVMKALKAADPKAVWVMQSWFLLQSDIWKQAEKKAFFDGILEAGGGKDAFIMDLYSEVRPQWEVTEGFFGIEWGWSMLNNFGGTQGMYGALDTILAGPFEGYRQTAKKMRGMGITMEGINNNEYVYQIVFDIPWESVEATDPEHSKNLTKPSSGQELKQSGLNKQKHLEGYIRRRYGSHRATPTVLEAWETLSQTVWNCTTGQVGQSRSIMDSTPGLDMYRPGFMTTQFWYNQTRVVRAWNQFVGSVDISPNKGKQHSSFIQSFIGATIGATSGKPINPTTQLAVKEKYFLLKDPKAHKTGIAESFSSKMREAIRSTVEQGHRVPPEEFLDMDIHLDDPDPPMSNSSLRYDLVDVTREVLAAVVIPGLHRELVVAYKAKDLASIRSWGRLILDCISDVDRILSTHTHFMSGAWIRDARVSAKFDNATTSYNDEDLIKYRDYVEYSARNQITWWGPLGQKPLADYAGKEWSGVVRGFYYPRWQIFVNRLTTAVLKGKQLDYRAYLEDSVKVEAKWVSSTSGKNGDGRSAYLVTPIEDTINVVLDLWYKWRGAAERYAETADK